jgi:hypothetical protein
MSQTRMNWGGMIRTAAGAGLTPQDFWRLSLAEWLALTAPDRSAMTRRELMMLLDEIETLDTEARHG